MSEAKKYYLICPLKATGRTVTGFTYSSSFSLDRGCLVKIPLGKRTVWGIVLQQEHRPKFKTKATIGKTAIIIPEHILKLANWMSEYYVTPLSNVLNAILPDRLDLNTAFKNTSQRYQHTPAPISLHSQQKNAINQILKSNQRNFLLQGETGSGKTQVYIELAKTMLKQNRSSIILVPEIALTPQMLSQFYTVFKTNIFITHSHLTSAQRRAIWQKINASLKPSIIIGPRSALFSPINNLGLIVIDEAHESSYKQEQAPRYQTASAAAVLARLMNAKLVLGTATPTVQDMFLVNAKKLELVLMPERIHQTDRAKTEVIDLKDNSNLTRASYISKPLLNALQKNLKANKQSLLFINRRGSATSLICANCGWIALSESTHLPLTFHADQGKLRDHISGKTYPVPAVCPECNNLQLKFLGIGTKKVENELEKLLPTARIARLDKDSFDAKNLDQLMQNLHDGKIDILVGTQMITKGLDMPNITTVGVILADTMLFIPDFTAAERTFQLLYQFSGRAGRRKGMQACTIIQTYTPNHPAVKYAAEGRFNDFIDGELNERKLLNYPPYSYLLKLEVKRTSRKSAQSIAQKLKTELETKFKSADIEMVGPAPSFYEVLGNKYYWQLIIKSKKRQNLVEIAKAVPADWRIDLDPINLL